MKGHDGMKLPELKKVVRAQKFRYPGMLTMKKADLIRNMKKRGMWESGKAPGGPKSMRKKTKGQQLKERALAMKAKREKPKSKLDKGQKDFLAGIY
tara:strand:+ start:53 stop:340 length:288 start_codon:yes stop_codon:yes gene_type:complete